MKWGLPNSEHFCLFDSDEYTAIMLLEHMNPQKLNFFPQYFPYNQIFPDPVFHYYIVGAALAAASKLQFVHITKDKAFYLKYPYEYAKLFIVGRVLSLIMGLLTIIITYVLGRKIYSKETGILAAFFLCIIPLHVVYSAVLNVAEPVAMWILLAVYFAVMFSDTKKTKWYVLAGISAGFAIGTKYTALPLFAVILASHIFTERKIVFNKNLCLCLTAVILSFFITNPYFLLKFSDFIGSFTMRLHYVMNSQNIPALAHRGYLFPITSLLNHSMGFPLLAVSILGILSVLIKRTKNGIILLSWVIPYYFLNAHSGLYFIRYQAEQLPFFAIFAGKIFVDLYRFSRTAAILLFLFVSAPTLALTLINTNLLSSEFPRTLASRWITANIKDGSSIGTAQLPHEYYPPVIFMQFHHETRYREAPLEKPLYAISNLNWEPSKLSAVNPAYMVLTGTEYTQEYLLQPGRKDFIGLIDKEYVKIKEFEIQPSFLGMKFKNKEYPAWIVNYDKVLIFKKVSEML
jgi:hypothetical protein